MIPLTDCYFFFLYFSLSQSVPICLSFDPNEKSQIITGAFLYLCSLLPVLSSHRTLKNNWSVQRAAAQKHRLNTGGPYRYIRHPMYTAFLGMMIGQLLLSTNWSVGLFGIASLLLLFLLRIPREEDDERNLS